MTSPDTSKLFPGRFFIDSVLDAADTKIAMSRNITIQYLQRAAMAGILIGMFYSAYYAVVGTFAGIPASDAVSFEGLGKFLGALVFGWALVFIYFTKSELLTSNMMLTSIAVYYKRVKVSRAATLLALCFVGNFLGGLLLALLLKFSSMPSEAALEQMLHSVDTKLGYVTSASGMGDLFVRAVLCNLMINVAMLLVYNGFIKDAITMALAMGMSVFIFAFTGLEHSVANTVLFTIVGLKHGIDVGLAAGNVAIALLGNFIGGGFLIGVYYAYVNDTRRIHPHDD
ncbi:MAG: formate/nitrite transporter family protein [Propioniciclava sp.]|uniref:formate/nitrite transporter family protein n=1 Tax=Propioniciclava sp. TaxID=2038686 RepID=UPI0039E57A1A